MSHFCSNCEINFTRLSEDEDGVEFCPLCKFDMYLSENEEPGYNYCSFDGSLTHEITGEKTMRKYPNAINSIRKIGERNLSFLPYEEYIEKKQSIEDAAIDAYTTSGDQSAYFNTIKDLSKDGK